MDLVHVAKWLFSAIAVPVAISVCGQLFAERARREHLRLARDQFELANMIDGASESQAEELRRRAMRETAKYLQAPRKPKYVLIISSWIYVGVAAALIALGEIQTRAEAGPGPLRNWIIFAMFGALLGVLVAYLHIGLKDEVLNLTNRGLAVATRGKVKIPRPAVWGSPSDR